MKKCYKAMFVCGHCKSCRRFTTFLKHTDICELTGVKKKTFHICEDKHDGFGAIPNGKKHFRCKTLVGQFFSSCSAHKCGLFFNYYSRNSYWTKLTDASQTSQVSSTLLELELDLDSILLRE